MAGESALLVFSLRPSVASQEPSVPKLAVLCGADVHPSSHPGSLHLHIKSFAYEI